jgi:peptidoglycan/LPS O-acetylase OafA/YrhL
MMQKKIYFENLDSLRFLCFLSIFFYHSFYTASVSINESEPYRILTREIFGNGNIGVNFFFVLSGFLITYLLIEEKKMNTNISIPKFWMRRILRIWPLFFACVFVGFIIFPEIKALLGQASHETANPVYYFTFLNNFDVINSGLPDSSVLGVLWSIAIEEQFYFVLPIIIYITPIKRLWLVFVGVLAISLYYRYNNYTYLNYEYHTFSCMSDLAIGGLAAWLIIEFKSVKGFIENLNKPTIVLIYVGFISLYFFKDDLIRTFPFLLTSERLILSIFIILIILEQTFCTNSIFKLGRIKVFTRFGKITYGMYSLHFIGIIFALAVTDYLGINKTLWQIILIDTPIAFAFSLIIASISYTFYEKPFLKLKSRFQFITRDDK